ncbi:dTDP-glucose 4,6-dehydratase [Paractinoplanes rishiriensis]|uniref:dTDP-glucose 4,6-dehydratase n=1 Tax=Paractinoplanes rishiriensis TaxID=1050105 RepID=A0A919JUM0_9ACTN|nr:GDP-mannose 4,6-dehydratase [Actinoplanes rishiriensis]GIE95100.1 dTDP-glucose 4,6-dehydratase [Actinoplanes rishiriensis]
MNLLVTGGAGFIGSHFVRALLSNRLPGLEGSSVTVLDRVAEPENLAGLDGFRYVSADIGDAPSVGSAVYDQDVIVHFAAAEQAESGDFAATNMMGTQVLLWAALRHRVPRFVQVSTAEVYGSIDDGAWTENAPAAPITPYAASKAGADQMALTYHESHGLPVMVVRATATYGSHQHPSNPVPRLITSALDDRPVEVPDNGRVRDWLHVEDHCRALGLVVAGGRAGEIYHVGGSLELAHHDLAELVLDECGTGWSRVVAVAEDETGDERQVLDDFKIRHELGWRPQVEFTSGLADTVDWYRKNSGWWRPLLG